MIYKDLKRKAENPAGCFTLEQVVTDTMTLNTSTLSSVLNHLGKLSVQMWEMQIHPPCPSVKKNQLMKRIYTLDHILHFGETDL